MTGKLALCEAEAHLVGQAWGKAAVAARRGLVNTSLTPEIEGRLRFYAGKALLHTGDLYQAEAELDRFRALAADTPALGRLAGDAALAQSRVMALLRRPDEEAACLRDAVLLFAAQGRTARALDCRCALAWNRLTNGRPEEAQPELTAASAGLAADGYPELEISLTLTRALDASLRGQLDISDDLCYALGADLSLGQSADRAWILAANALVRGDMEQAAAFALQAQTAAAENWWPPQLTRIAELQERLHAAQRVTARSPRPGRTAFG